MTTKTYIILKALESKHVSGSLSELIEHARLNKILLYFLRELGIEGDVRDKEESRFKFFIKSLSEVVSILSKFDKGYTFFKLLKPIDYVPADVDILINNSILHDLVRAYLRNGFTLSVIEPYTITLTKGSFIVDLYTYPSLGNIVFMDSSILFEHTTKRSIYGYEVITLEEYAEAVVTLMHALVKEWIFTLNDYFTISKWFNNRSIKLCEDMECSDLAETALRICNLVESGAIETPYHLPTSVVISILASRFRRYPIFRSTTIMFVKRFGDPRLLKLAISKLTRITY